MKYRLLIITFLSIVFTAFTNVADNVIDCCDLSEIVSTIEPSSNDSEISAPCNDIVAARQNNFTTNGPTRTLTKRTSVQRNLGKFQIYISAGKTVSSNNIDIYQIIHNLLPSGLREIHRNLIRLGKLII